MIQSKKELVEYIQSDNCWLLPNSYKQKIWEKIADYPVYELRKYLEYLRKQEYYINTANGSKIKALQGLIYERKKNKLGMKLGIEISPNTFGKGLSIYHSGCIIVNSAVKIGENCKLHGSNCIGNNGKTDKVPHIGNNVDIGFGAIIIGDVEIADDVVIGANAVVNHSVYEVGCTVVGAPARIVKRKD